MRIVKITRDLRPFRAGQDAVLDDVLAARLVKDGDASDSRPFPPADVRPASAAEPQSAQATAKSRTFMTRKRG
jgi:hypothetical protein